MMIARRADTKARADFATWKMMAKLNGASALPDRSPGFSRRLQDAAEENAGAGGDRGHHHPDLPPLLRGDGRHRHARPMSRPMPAIPSTNNVTAFRRPPAEAAPAGSRLRRKAAAAGGPDLRLPRRGLCRDPVLFALKWGMIGFCVMAGLVPAIARLSCRCGEDVDARTSPGMTDCKAPDSMGSIIEERALRASRRMKPAHSPLKFTSRL